MSRLHDCREELRAVGSRATPGRLALLQVLEKEAQPLTVAQMSRKLRALNKVTLYRALQFLVSVGLVRQGSVGGSARFEYARRPHHHHLVCSDCGFIPQCRTC